MKAASLVLSLAVGLTAAFGRTVAEARDVPRTAAKDRPLEFWVWHWNNLRDERDFRKATNVLLSASAAGCNAMAFSIDEEAYWDTDRAARIGRLAGLASRAGVEMVPCLWSVGYGDAVVAEEPDAVESTPMRNLRYRVANGKAHYVPDRIVTGYEGAVATNKVVLRFGSQLKPFHTYRLTCRVRTEKVSPVRHYSFRGVLFHGKGREQELYDFPVGANQDWRKYWWEFNTYSNATADIDIYVNRGEGVSGTAWIDTIVVEDRPLTRCLTDEPWMRPVVRSARTGRTYVEGKDYRPFPKMRAVRADTPFPIVILPDGAIAEGEELVVDAHVPAVEGAGQYSACPSSRLLNAYFRRSADAVNGLLHPRRWFIGINEWRVANRCEKCRARNVSPGRLMGECVSDMCGVIRAINPKADLCVWADMYCPLENAGRRPYYCVDGSMEDSWKYVPKDLIMIPWMNGRDDVKTTKWLMARGFRCLAGGYYNYPDLSRDIAWRDACKDNPLFLGMMFTTWGGGYGDGGYDKLAEYGRMVRGEAPGE